MDLSANLRPIRRELGLPSSISTQLQSDIKKYIGQWNRLAPPGGMFHELSEVESDEHCSRYLDNGWDRKERLEKGGGKDIIVPPGRIFWQSPFMGQKRPKHQYPQDSKEWVAPHPST